METLKSPFEEPGPSAGSRFSLEEEHDVNLLSELFKEIFMELGERRNQLVARENVLVFKHGANWSGYTKTSDSSTKHWNSGFKKHSAQVEISWDRIFSADFSAIEEFKNSFVKTMTANFESSLFETIADATNDRPAIELKLSGDIRPGLLQLWEDIHLGLNDDMSLSQPFMALDPGSFEKFMIKARDLETTDPGFIDQINLIKMKKWIAALDEHFENLLKYHLYDDERRNIEHQLRQIRQIAFPELHQDGRDNDQGEPN